MMEKFKKGKFKDYDEVTHMVTNHTDAKVQLSIQRCYSDGVLSHGQLSSENKTLSSNKSSSESSMNGSPVTTPTNSSPQNKTAIEDDCRINGSHSREIDCFSRQSDAKLKKADINSSNVVRPKTWKRRIAEKKFDVEQTKGRNGDLEHQINGLEISNGIHVHNSRYPQNVCDLHDNENDTELFLSRLRGGVRRGVGVNGYDFVCIENGIDDTSRQTDNNKEESPMSNCANASTSSNGACNEIRADIQCLIAPLAVPENLSDEEALSSSPSTSTESTSSDKDNTDDALINGNNMDSSCSENDTSTLSVGCSNVNLPKCFQGVSRILPRSSTSSHTDKVVNGAECLAYNPEVQHSNISIGSDDIDDHIEEDIDEQNEVVQENVQPVRASSVASFDSIDDIGDFIEADLPPNVERLAFFSRGSSVSSSTEEDEGCGDEVLPGHFDGEDSENETIDPLTSNSNARYPFQNDPSKTGTGDRDLGLPSRTDDVRYNMNSLAKDGYASNLLSCSDNGDDTHLCNNCACGGAEDSQKLQTSRPDSEISHQWNTFVSDERNVDKSSNKTDDTCVCCDKTVDINFQRIEELGVNVCDKCFNEHDFERNSSSENAVKRRSKNTTSSFSFNSYFPKRNSNSLHVVKNMQEKVNNNSLSSFRLSSSDSEPLDRLYVSDSSEMVSPEGESAAELVFHPVGVNLCDGAASNITEEGNVLSVTNITDGSENGSAERPNRINTRANVQFNNEQDGVASVSAAHRQSVSMEFNNPDEVIYCPYFNRRSRSLEQDSSDSVSYSRSPDCDIPNIAVATSNFQDDESNNQKKLFEKQAYELDLIQACSSSDEEENTRVPAVAADIGDFMPETHAGLLMQENVGMPFPRPSMERYKRRNKALSLEEEEPIYEDIDDLELLLEEVCSDGEPDNTRAPAQPLCSAINKLRRKRRHRSPLSNVEKVMIWNEYEAYVVQVKQIGTSACGPTAVLNVLKAFDYQVEKEEVVTTITANLRMEAAPIPYYLFSRYSAGTTAQTLVEGVNAVTRGAIKGRFFHLYPPRDVELLKWLGYWMKKGAVPVATLNLQRAVKRGWTIPDAWHHQMVYGVSSKGVYLTNPLEIVPESIILEQLMSDSVLLVRRQDVVSRFRDWCPLNEILKQRDPRWRTMNVLGQIVHMLREHCMPQEQLAGMRGQLTSHICIPAAYKAGISLFMKAKSDGYEELMKAPELPLRNSQQQPSGS